MNKNILSLALVAAAAVAAPAFAQDASSPTAQQGWYVGANAGYAQADSGNYNSNGEFAGGVKGGYRFAINPAVTLGAEVGYTYLGRYNAPSSYLQTDGSGKSKLQGATAGLNMRFNFAPDWYAELRGGAFFAKGQALSSDATNPQFDRFNSTSYYAGAGVGYNITPKWSVGLNYDYYNASDDAKNIHLPTDLYTVSAEYRF